MREQLTLGVAAMVLLIAAPVAVSGCGMCFHSDCGPNSVTVSLTPEADGAARATRVCFDGQCETVERVDVGGARTFERPLPAVGAVEDADDVELTIALLDASGAELGTFTDRIDIDAGECECATVDVTWDGTGFDRFN